MSDYVTARLREHANFLETRSWVALSGKLDRETANEIERNRATMETLATLSAIRRWMDATCSRG